MSGHTCAYCHRTPVAGSPELGIYACVAHERDAAELVAAMIRLRKCWAERRATAARPA